MANPGYRDSHNRFRGLRAILRFPWQRRGNVVPVGAAPTMATREEANDGFFVAPLSERRGDLAAVPPLVPGNEAAHFLLHDYAPPRISVKNPLRLDLWLADLALWRDRAPIEPVNRLDSAVRPDGKTGDEYGEIKNHEEPPLFITDPDLSRRLKFMRFLVQRGTFNEGSVPSEQVDLYRTFADLFDDTDDTRRDYD
jgi:hypothetical protein